MKYFVVLLAIILSVNTAFAKNPFKTSKKGSFLTFFDLDKSADCDIIIAKGQRKSKSKKEAEYDTVATDRLRFHFFAGFSCKSRGKMIQYPCLFQGDKI